MTPSHAPVRLLTELDHVRLQHLLKRQPGAVEPSPVLSVLEDADLVPSRAVPPDVITMNSRLLVRDDATGERRALTLCYPDDADAPAGRISVLSPMGASLLGLTVGATARWRGSSGRPSAVRVLALTFQPEAQGLFTL